MNDVHSFALALADDVGAIASSFYHQTLAVRNKGDGHFDPVTEADVEIERRIREKISQKFPAHSVFGEELPDHGQRDGSPAWVIDPIDGTRAFVLGLPTWGILIAFLEKDTPSFGIMYQPIVDELYFGDGTESFRRSQNVTTPIRVSDTAELSAASLCCTHPDMFSSEGDRACFDRLERKCKTSRYGTDCLGYTALARGRADLICEGGLKSVDTAALIPIVEGAGGIITDWSGHAAFGAERVLVASTEALHQRAQDALGGDGH